MWTVACTCIIEERMYEDWTEYPSHTPERGAYGPRLGKLVGGGGGVNKRWTCAYLLLRL